MEVRISRRENMMTKNKNAISTDGAIAPLCADDLDAVVAIDKALSGTSRRDFFKRRLAAALEDPRDFVYVGLHDTGNLVGYAFARMVDGEFGKPGARATLDIIGVDPAHQGKNAGHRLLQAVENVLRHKGVSELTSQVEWSNQDMLRFFASSGFDVAPRIVLTRSTAQPIM